MSPTKETADSPSFPAIEHILGTEHPIHDTTVIIVDQHNTEHEFLVSYQYNLQLPVNHSLRRIVPGRRWNGELIVMKKGTHRFVRHLRAGYETMLAMVALQR